MVTVDFFANLMQHVGNAKSPALKKYFFLSGRAPLPPTRRLRGRAPPGSAVASALRRPCRRLRSAFACGFGALRAPHAQITFPVPENIPATIPSRGAAGVS